MNKTGKSISSAGWIIIGASVALSAFCYWSYQKDVPVVAPYLDELTLWIYASFPLAVRFNPSTPELFACALVGAAFLLIASITYRLTYPSTAHERLERRLRKQSDRDREKRLGKDDFIAN